MKQGPEKNFSGREGFRTQGSPALCVGELSYSHAKAWLYDSVCQKSSCLPHSWGRWPSEARSEGVHTFLRKVGISEYLLCKYSDSPRPSATPLINEGGKIVGSLTSCMTEGGKR